jgi:hypothetical protein
MVIAPAMIFRSATVWILLSLVLTSPAHASGRIDISVLQISVGAKVADRGFGRYSGGIDPLIAFGCPQSREIGMYITSEEWELRLAPVLDIEPGTTTSVNGVLRIDTSEYEPSDSRHCPLGYHLMLLEEGGMTGRYSLLGAESFYQTLYPLVAKRSPLEFVLRGSTSERCGDDCNVEAKLLLTRAK